MTLIDKKRVVAKIERLMDETMDEDNYFYSAKAEAQYNILLTLKNSIDYIDTLEVKEVDLDKEITSWAHELYEIPYDEVERVAKHFFELGINSRKV